MSKPPNRITQNGGQMGRERKRKHNYEWKIEQKIRWVLCDAPHEHTGNGVMRREQNQYH